MIVKARHDDVAALVEPQPAGRRPPQNRLGDGFHPGAGGVDQNARCHHLADAAGVEDEPPDVAALGADTARAGADDGATLGGVDCVEHHQPRIIGKAIGILVAAMEMPLERLTRRVGDEIERPRARQDLTAPDQIVNEETEPEHDRRTTPGIERQHEAKRPDQVRRHPQQHLALAERCVHQAERAVFQIAKPAMDQLRGRRRRARRQVVLFEQHDLQAAPGGVARDAGAVDAAADDREIEIGHAPCP